MAKENHNARYSSIAVGLHWLIALAIIGLIIVAKVSESLESDDPLRFTLIQWHKSFGIAVLLLVLFRIVWRLFHKPPALPVHMGWFERFVAATGHLGLYALMLAMPLTGWALVSASPLNLATELFGIIPWPHIPWLENIADKALWEGRFHSAHFWLSNALIALALGHAAAAMRHQFWIKDGLMSRMTIAPADQYGGLLFGVLIAAAGVIGLVGYTDRQSMVDDASAGESSAVAAATSQVGFSASQMGEPLNGVFEVHEISLMLDDAKLSDAVLSASVNTASISTGDSQVDATVVTAEWFASGEFPLASFASQSITKTADGVYEVDGSLTIRDVAKEVAFTLQREADEFSGTFTIDRRDFGVGVGGQDEFVAPEVSISFRFTR